MNPSTPPKRCRIVLIAPEGAAPDRILSALDGGDVASLILPAWSMDDDAFQNHAEAIVPQAQTQGVAVMIAGDARIAMRARADGLHVEEKARLLAETIERHHDKLMIGVGGATTRDDALQIGELRPDYVFFGRFGFDDKPEPHPRNLKIGAWWAEMVDLPCIVAAGSDLAGVIAVAATGAEFVALSAAVYGGERSPADVVAAANAMLDEQATGFQE